MSDQPSVPTGRLDHDQVSEWVHLPGATTRELDARQQRAMQARIARLLREADQAEGAALAEVLDQLAALQTTVRATLTTAPEGTPFAVLWNELEDRIDDAMAGVAGTVSRSLDDAAAAGARLVDEALAAIGGTPLDAAADDVTAEIRVTVRQMIAESHQNLKLRTTQQVLQLTSGRQDLARTLRLVGDGLRGSSVFGAPTARVARVVRTEMGDAHGAGVNARSEQVNAAATPGGYVAMKRWVWSHDPTGGRESHAFAERRYAPGGEIGPIPSRASYRIGRFSTPYPRGPGLPGAEKVNCGCRSVPVLMALDTEEAA